MDELKDTYRDPFFSFLLFEGFRTVNDESAVSVFRRVWLCCGEIVQLCQK